jgi:hypothetical protein
MTMASLVQTSNFVDFFLLFWLAVHLNGFAAEGKGFRTLLFLFLLFPVQAYSLTTTLENHPVFISNLILNTMINCWLVFRAWPILRQDPIAGYRKMVGAVRKEIKSRRKLHR